MFKKLIDSVRAKILSSKYQGEPITGQELLLLLDRVISPRVYSLGLKWHGDYTWISESINGIRKLVHYGRFTRSGIRGCISWGISLDFVMIPKGNKLIHNRTKKTAMIHIGEWSDGYLRSFRGEEMIDGVGVASHFSHIAEKTLTQAIEGELNNIKAFYDNASSLDQIIEIAKNQLEISESSFANMRFPSPAYILAFIYAKLGNLQLANDYLQRDGFMSDPKNAALLNLVKDQLEQLTANQERH
jgi:hypothetical protein